MRKRAASDASLPEIKEDYPDFDFQETVTVNALGLRYQGDAGKGVGFLTDGQLEAAHRGAPRRTPSAAFGSLRFDVPPGL